MSSLSCWSNYRVRSWIENRDYFVISVQCCETVPKGYGAGISSLFSIAGISSLFSIANVRCPVVCCSLFAGFRLVVVGFARAWFSPVPGFHRPEPSAGLYIWETPAWLNGEVRLRCAGDFGDYWENLQARTFSKTISDLIGSSSQRNVKIKVHAHYAVQCRKHPTAYSCITVHLEDLDRNDEVLEHVLRMPFYTG
ncbi:hypothetical protein RHMOL_Rhmol07G0189700 [Rhododendron molle]|uniref:Uncharacterized protein n=1 Tax=Rhododendron molle TaxID=49168 RepID=A0ACC0N473_RHOML|nr:hypothetical protein RHMOL_Rhmol07G0189700 [Rhododendron molle]